MTFAPCTSCPDKPLHSIFDHVCQWPGCERHAWGRFCNMELCEVHAPAGITVPWEPDAPQAG